MQTSGSACVDLVASEIIEYDTNKFIVKLGFSTEISDGYKIVIVPRSSFTNSGWVMQNSPAQIDSDYRGEWILKLEGIPQINYLRNTIIYKDFPYKVGDRVAQCYLEKVIPTEFEEVEELNITERKGGFGSTGIN